MCVCARRILGDVPEAASGMPDSNVSIVDRSAVDRTESWTARGEILLVGSRAQGEG
jgi:hypothetical protein